MGKIIFLLSPCPTSMLHVGRNCALSQHDQESTCNEVSFSCCGGCRTALVSSQQIFCDCYYLIRLEAELSLKLF